MDVKYYWEEFLFWMEERENWYRLAGIIVVLLVTVIGISYIRQQERVGIPQTPEETVVWLLEESDDLKNNFSLLDHQKRNQGSDYPIHEIYLYMKNPFLTEDESQRLLTKYVELIKVMDDQEGTMPQAVRFTLYDRKILFDNNLAHRGVFEYRYPNSSVKESDLQQYGAERTETVRDAAWRLTTENTKKPKYDNYRLESMGYRVIRDVPGVEPLSDQEFEWYLKYDLYQLLGNDPSKTLLEWDFGASDRIRGMTQIDRQFDRFSKRLSEVGDLTNFWDYPDGKKQELIISHPQLLYYMLTDEVAESDIDARRRIYASNPSLYQDTLIRWVETLSAEQVRAIENETGGNITDTNDLGTFLNTDEVELMEFDAYSQTETNQEDPYALDDVGIIDNTEPSEPEYVPHT